MLVRLVLVRIGNVRLLFFVFFLQKRPYRLVKTKTQRPLASGTTRINLQSQSATASGARSVCLLFLFLFFFVQFRRRSVNFVRSPSATRSSPGAGRRRKNRLGFTCNSITFGSIIKQLLAPFVFGLLFFWFWFRFCALGLALAGNRLSCSFFFYSFFFVDFTVSSWNWNATSLETRSLRKTCSGGDFFYRNGQKWRCLRSLSLSLSISLYSFLFLFISSFPVGTATPLR